MPSDNPRVPGVVEAARGNGFFSVEVTIENIQTNEQEQRTVMCQLSGKMRTHNIKVVEGDNVDVELDLHDMKKGRIIYRRR